MYSHLRIFSISFTRIGGIPSDTTEDGDGDRDGVPTVLLSTRSKGRDGTVGIRSGCTGRRGHEVTGEPVME